MEERGVEVDHSSINRWAIRFLPLLEQVFRNHKRPVGLSWRMDETYILVKDIWNVSLPRDRQGRPNNRFPVDREEGQECSNTVFL